MSTEIESSKQENEKVKNAPKKSNIKKKIIKNCSWENLEEKRETLVNLARQFKELDGNLEVKYGQDFTTSETMNAFNRKSQNPEFFRLGKVLRGLVKLQSELVHTYHLDWYFVHREWASIMNPSDANIHILNNSVKSG